MPEILTESFCERCGTRYTFESATPRGPRLKGLKVMSRGLKNFVLSDDTSMDEAMAAARNETDREQTAQQLDAFHKTFNFCMSCRQYTCGNCWNEADGRCLSCAPHLGHEVLPAPFGNVAAGGAVTLTGPETIGLHDRNGNGAETPPSAEPMAWPEAERMAWPEPEPMAWPTADVTQGEDGADGPQSFQDVIDAAARLEAVAGPVEAEPEVEEVAPVDEVAADTDEVAPVEAAPPVQAAVEPEPEPEAIEPLAAAAQAAPPPPAAADVPATPAPAEDVADDRAAAAAAKTGDLLRRFRPGESIDDEIAAYEREQIAVASAAMVAAAEAAAAEADASEAAAQAAAEMAAAEARAVAQVEEAEARAAAEVAARAAALEAEDAARAAAEAQARAAAQAAEAQARAAAEAQAREAAEAQEAAARAAAEAAAAEEAAAAAEPRDDVVYQPTWQIVAPEPPTADRAPTPQQPAIPPSPPAGQPISASAEPQWPSRPEWPRPPSADGLPFLGRPPAASGGIEALWAESAREVADIGPGVGAKPAGGVQPCVSCGLSLSANARFCRRCGTRQG